MIDRYSVEEISELWSDEYRFGKMLEIEILVCEAWNKKKVISDSDLTRIKKNAKVNISDIRRREKNNHHETVAFVESISSKVGKGSRYIHSGLTSSDVLDTALSLAMRGSLDLIIGKLKIFKKALIQNGRKYKNLVMIGRTHGVHGEPITLGLKFLNWADEADRCLEKLDSTKETVSYGKISGSVGTYAHLSPSIEKYVCRKLKLKSASITNQILQRDRHTDYMYGLVSVGNLLEKIAMEIRHLHRTEIGELGEPFAKGQKGSSSMPHKKNPITCEKVCGLSRVLRGNLLTSLENTPLWNERDISHSSVERIILADSSHIAYHILENMFRVITDLVVNKEKISENLEKTKGNIHSQAVMLKLASKGVDKEKAYKITQSAAFKDEEDYLNSIMNDKRVEGILNENDFEDLKDYSYYTKYVDQIFKRF